MDSKILFEILEKHYVLEIFDSSDDPNIKGPQKSRFTFYGETIVEHDGKISYFDARARHIGAYLDINNGINSGSIVEYIPQYYNKIMRIIRDKKLEEILGN